MNWQKSFYTLIYNLKWYQSLPTNAPVFFTDFYIFRNGCILLFCWSWGRKPNRTFAIYLIYWKTCCISIAFFERMFSMIGNKIDINHCKSLSLNPLLTFICCILKNFSLLHFHFFFQLRKKILTGAFSIYLIYENNVFCQLYFWFVWITSTLKI